MNKLRLSQAIFLCCWPACPTCSANAVHTGQATWAIWATRKKYSLAERANTTKYHKLFTVKPP